MNDNSPAYTTEYIADSAHYEKVIARVAGVKRQLWIGTADIKDLYVAQGRQADRPVFSHNSRADKKGRGDTSYTRQRAGPGIPGGLRPLP